MGDKGHCLVCGTEYRLDETALVQICEYCGSVTHIRGRKRFPTSRELTSFMERASLGEKLVAAEKLVSVADQQNATFEKLSRTWDGLDQKVQENHTEIGRLIDDL